MKLNDHVHNVESRLVSIVVGATLISRELVNRLRIDLTHSRKVRHTSHVLLWKRATEYEEILALWLVLKSPIEAILVRRITLTQPLVRHQAARLSPLKNPSQFAQTIFTQIHLRHAILSTPHPSSSSMSPPSRRPKRPSIALSKVPSVKELCELLGFQHASLKDTIKFTDATHAWRKSHRTSDGNLASELLLWNQPSVQMHLTEMAGKFLDDGNGDRFWSPNRSWSSHQEDELEYPQDRQK